MQTGATFDTSRIAISPAAREQINMILLEGGNKYIRVFVQGGGCSGFSYGFTVEDEPEEDDIITPIGDHIHLLVDPMSLQYLQEARIDWAEDSMGASFRIENPNAQSTCGCGSSFSPW